MKLILQIIALISAIAVTTFAQDPGIPDTVKVETVHVTPPADYITVSVSVFSVSSASNSPNFSLKPFSSDRVLSRSSRNFAFSVSRCATFRTAGFSSMRYWVLAQPSTPFGRMIRVQSFPFSTTSTTSRELIMALIRCS